MNSNMVKPEKFGHLHLVYHLTVPLNWVVNQSCPDIAFDVCNLSSNVKCPTIEDVIKLNEVVTKLKLNPLKSKFPVLYNLKNCSIKCFSDASLDNLPTGKSTEGLVIFICDEFGKCSPLNWKSRSIKTVVHSSLSAKTCAMVDALDAAYFMMFSFKEIIYGPIKENSLHHKIDAYTDSKSLYRNVHSTTMPEENRMRNDIK